MRIEIATALKRGIRVITVLVDGASNLRSQDLLEDLKALAAFDPEDGFDFSSPGMWRSIRGCASQ
jgi:hypothetical protein